MPLADQPTRRQLRSLLADPGDDIWGVELRRPGRLRRSEREYRLVVEHERTIVGYGRSSENGTVRVKVHNDHAAAVKTALTAWASMEHKGYRPVTGVVVPDSVDAGLKAQQLGYNAEAVIYWTGICYEQNYRSLAEGRPGDRLWLVQVPDTYGALMAVQALGEKDGPAWSRRRLNSGERLLIAADNRTGHYLRAVCPVAVEMGSRTEKATTDLAEVACTMWRDLAEIPARQGLAEAIAAATSILRV